MLKIHSIETFGTHEGPGIRLVVFTQGCNFQCVYCENPDTQNAESSKKLSGQEIIDLLDKEKIYFKDTGGITFSGGEPTFQADQLLLICQQIKQSGYHVALDTNGSIWSESVKKLYDLVDLIILDIKHINNDWHCKITGASNKQVLRSAEYREQTGKPMWVRYVLVPGFSDQLEYINQLGQFLQSFKTIERLEILPYHTLGKHKYAELNRKYPLESVPVPDQALINSVKSIFEKYIKVVKIR
jgi:pyruvate formate lyase activating enzyme